MGTLNYKIGSLDFNVIDGAYFIDNYNCCKQSLNGYMVWNCNTGFCSTIPFGFSNNGQLIENLIIGSETYNITNDLKFDNCNINDITINPTINQDEISIFFENSISGNLTINSATHPYDTQKSTNLLIRNSKLCYAEITCNTIFIKNTQINENSDNNREINIYTNDEWAGTALICIDNLQFVLTNGFTIYTQNLDFKCKVSNSSFNNFTIHGREAFME